MSCKPSNSDSFAESHLVFSITLHVYHIIISIRTFFDEGLQDFKDDL